MPVNTPGSGEQTPPSQISKFGLPDFEKLETEVNRRSKVGEEPPIKEISAIVENVLSHHMVMESLSVSLRFQTLVLSVFEPLLKDKEAIATMIGEWKTTDYECTNLVGCLEGKPKENAMEALTTHLYVALEVQRQQPLLLNEVRSTKPTRIHAGVVASKTPPRGATSASRGGLSVAVPRQLVGLNGKPLSLFRKKADQIQPKPVEVQNQASEKKNGGDTINDISFSSDSTDSTFQLVSPKRKQKRGPKPPKAGRSEDNPSDAPIRQAAASMAEETFLTVGSYRNGHASIGIKRPGYQMDFIRIDATQNTIASGKIMGTDIDVSIEPRGMNFGRDKDGRQVQYGYVVRIKGKSYRCVSRLPIIRAIKGKHSGEDAMHALRYTIWNDYKDLVERFGKPGEKKDTWY